MPIITISRGSYGKGREVAETLAERLNYDCVSREIILEASQEFNIPEIKLRRALHDPASVLDRFSHGRERYINYFCSALLNYLKKDNVVYHGLAGHFFLQDISHVIKIRIISDIKDRIIEEMKHENSSAEKALYSLKKDDEERRKWGLQLYGKDTSDPIHYDIVVNLTSLTVDDAVEVIYNISQKPAFRLTAKSKQNLTEAALIADIKARISEYAPRVTVTLEGDVILLHNIDEFLNRDTLLRGKIEEILGTIEGVKEIKFEVSTTNKHSYINVFHNIG